MIFKYNSTLLKTTTDNKVKLCTLQVIYFLKAL